VHITPQTAIEERALLLVGEVANLTSKFEETLSPDSVWVALVKKDLRLTRGSDPRLISQYMMIAQQQQQQQFSESPKNEEKSPVELPSTPYHSMKHPGGQYHL
jgi:hypothetical protein